MKEEEIDGNENEVTYEQAQVFNNILENKIGFGYYQKKVLSTVAFLDFNDGTVFIMIGIVAPIIEREFLEKGESDGILRILRSIYFIGMIIGSFISGYFSDKYGRKSIIQFSSFLYAFICLYSLVIKHPHEIIVQQFLYGIIFSLTIPLSTTMYSEVSPKSQRSNGVMMINLFVTLGQLYSIFLSWLVLDDINHGNWRKLMALQSIQGLIVGFGATFLFKESPRYLMQQRRIQETIDVLNIMIKDNKGNQINEQTKDTLLVSKEEMDQLIYYSAQNEAAMQNKKSKLKVYLLNITHLIAPKYRLMTINLGAIHALITITCIGLIFTFPIVLELHHYSSLMNMVIICLGEFPAFFIIAYLNRRKVGRKNALLLFSFILSISSLIMYLRLALIVPFFVCCFCYRSFYILLFTYVNEIYPTYLRSTGMGINNSVSRFGASLVPFVVLELFKINQFYPYLLFCIFGLVMAALSYTLPYETSQIGLDEQIVVATHKLQMNEKQGDKECIELMKINK